MGILRDFERRLEGAVEGLFARAFRSGVQPVELGKRLVREVEDGRTVGVNRVYVPNVYVYELSPGDRERFADYEVALAQELAALAVDTARERDWAMLGPARIQFETAEDLPVGRFRLGGRVEPDEQERDYAAAAQPGAAQAVGPHTAMLPGQRRRPKVQAPASLVLVQGGQPVADQVGDGGLAGRGQAGEPDGDPLRARALRRPGGSGHGAVSSRRARNGPNGPGGRGMSCALRCAD